MSMDGTYTAVVDRFEDDLAVLILERDGDAVDDIAVDRTSLPDGTGEGTVLRVVLDDGWIVDVSHDSAATDARRDAAQDRFDGLADRPPEDDDG